LFRNHDILPFDCLIKFNSLKLIHSIIYDYCHPPLKSFISLNESRDTGYDLRNNEQLLVPYPKTDMFKKFPLYNYPKLWNEAGDIIFHSNPITFSIALKMELFDKLT
jgi:hypothetical protein